MARSVQAKNDGRHVGKAPPRRRKSRSLLTHVAIGFGLTVAALTGASMVTLATAVKPASSVRLEMSLARPIPQPVATAPAGARALDVAKFSRLPGSAPVDPKAARIAGADVAALEARRPDRSNAAQIMTMAMVAAARNAESDQQFAALIKRRPDAGAIRAVLAPAMENLVVVAPRGGNAMPDLIQDATTVASVAELKDMKPVEMAALEDNTTDTGENVADTEVAIVEEQAPAVAAAPGYDLPKAGPLPVIRPSTATAMVEKPAKPNALAAIAAVAPQQKPGRPADDSKPTVLAFAKPDNPMREAPAAPMSPAPNWPGIGSKVAIYDITNAVVHMPNGTKLEAHSGIGGMRDNPKFTHVKMRGPTPPGTYRLSMRESLFHGVAAIRLTPVDGRAPQGRTGLLAHSFLLRVRGDSHGCVAFAKYDQFLKAFQRGEITHMIIVNKWDGKRPGKGSGGDNFLVKLFGGDNA